MHEPSGELILELYLHGLAEEDFELALRGLLGEGAPLSKSSIRRLRTVTCPQERYHILC